MATLSKAEKFKIMRRAELKSNTASIPIRWAKQAIVDAAQAIEDAVDGTVNITRSEVPVDPGAGFNVIVSGRIDAATTPHGLTFTNSEKKWLFAFAS